MMSRLLSASITALMLSAASSAFAQDLAMSATLFEKGVAEMEAGKLESACPKIGESYRLDPRAGTLFTLAECEAKAGHVATAVARYEDYLQLYSRLPPDQQEKQKDRASTAREQKATLGPVVPLVTLILPQNAPQGTTVSRNDVTLALPALGLALPMDPGDYVLRTQAPGGPVNEQKFTIAKGEKKEITLTVKMADAPGAKSSSAITNSDSPSPAQSWFGPQRTAGFVVGGVGAGGLLLGGILGGITLGKKSSIDSNCRGTVCNQEGKSAADSAKTTGLVSTVGFIAGGVLLAGGIVVVLTAPQTKKKETAWNIEGGVRPMIGGAAWDVGGSF